MSARMGVTKADTGTSKEWVHLDAMPECILVRTGIRWYVDPPVLTALHDNKIFLSGRLRLL